MAFTWCPASARSEALGDEEEKTAKSAIADTKMHLTRSKEAVPVEMTSYQRL